MQLVGRAILSGTIINKNYDGGVKPFIPYYHSCNNIIMNWLENGNSVPQLRSLIEINCAPTNHKRSSGKVSKGNIANTMKILGANDGSDKLWTKIHTVEEIEKLGGAKVKVKEDNEKSGSFMGGLSSMVVSKNKNKRCSLAQRCSSQDSVLAGTTLMQLFEIIKLGKTTSLRIKPANSGKLQFAYSAKTGNRPQIITS